MNESCGAMMLSNGGKRLEGKGNRKCWLAWELMYRGGRVMRNLREARTATSQFDGAHLSCKVVGGIKFRRSIARHGLTVATAAVSHAGQAPTQAPTPGPRAGPADPRRFPSQTQPRRFNRHQSSNRLPSSRPPTIESAIGHELPLQRPWRPDFLAAGRSPQR